MLVADRETGGRHALFYCGQPFGSTVDSLQRIRIKLPFRPGIAGRGIRLEAADRSRYRLGEEDPFRNGPERWQTRFRTTTSARPSQWVR